MVHFIDYLGQLDLTKIYGHYFFKYFDKIRPPNIYSHPLSHFWKSIESFDYFTAGIHTCSRHYSRQLIPKLVPSGSLVTNSQNFTIMLTPQSDFGLKLQVLALKYF